MAGLVLVAGGSGFVGRAVCRALERGGYRAVIVSRWASSLLISPSPPSPVPPSPS